MAGKFMTLEESNARLNHPANAILRIPSVSNPSDFPIPTEPIIPEPDSSALDPSTEALEPPLDEPCYSGAEVRSSSSQSDSELDIHDLLKLNVAIDAGLDKKGRKAGIRNRTIEENASIALTQLVLGGPAGEEMFGVSQPLQSLLGQGYTGSVEQKKKNVKEELLDEIYSQGKLVTGKAFGKLLKSLDLLDDDKLAEIPDALKLVQVAKSLSGIVKDMTPKDADVSDAGVHFHIFRPEQNSESDYETLEVNKDGSVTLSI